MELANIRSRKKANLLVAAGVQLGFLKMAGLAKRLTIEDFRDRSSNNAFNISWPKNQKTILIQLAVESKD